MGQNGSYHHSIEEEGEKEGEGEEEGEEEEEKEEEEIHKIKKPIRLSFCKDSFRLFIYLYLQYIPYYYQEI